MTNKQFLKRMFVLAFPIAMQNLLSSCGYLVDTAMVVGLGNVATSAIGVASRWSFLANIVIFGVCSGGAVLSAQHWGAGNHDEIRRTTGLGVMAIALFSALYMAVSMVMPKQMMAVFTSEQAVIDAGAAYIRIAGAGILFSGISQVIGGAMRSTEDVKTPFIGSTCGVIINVFFNYSLIYGHFGMPRMGLSGAALATVISLVAQMCIILVLARVKQSPGLCRLSDIKALTSAFVRKYASIAAPVLVNEITWAVGTNIYSAILARQGSENYAAYTVFNSVHEIFFVLFIGLCNACAIMVGKSIGEGGNEAYKIAKKFFVAIPVTAVVLGAAQIILRYPILGLMDIETAAARETAASLLVLHGILMPLINIPYLAVVGVFRAGGDTKYGFFIDTFSIYALGVPVLAYMAYMTEATFVQMVAGMYLAEYILKTFLCIWRFKSGKWIRRLT
ncbi:MAG: MATE family efflux transporter [Clostridia bacterium]|nr:MATE family efflux transporter [Clostridia bacterium]